MRAPFSFMKGAAAPTFDPATLVLSSWLKESYVPANLFWGSSASAGTISRMADVIVGTSAVAGTTLDGKVSYRTNSTKRGELVRGVSDPYNTGSGGTSGIEYFLSATSYTLAGLIYVHSTGAKVGNAYENGCTGAGVQYSLWTASGTSQSAAPSPLQTSRVPREPGTPTVCGGRALQSGQEVTER